MNCREALMTLARVDLSTRAARACMVAHVCGCPSCQATIRTGAGTLPEKDRLLLREFVADLLAGDVLDEEFCEVVAAGTDR